jgi:hypothetical protein
MPSTSPIAQTPAASARASASSLPSAVASDAAVPFDADLLSVLPADVAGVPLAPEQDAFASSADDPALVRDAESGAVGFAMSPAGDDYAIAFVYRVRDDVFDEAWFRDWRDSFDEGVCAQAGGVTGRAEADIGDHHAYIGSCAGGVSTHHVHLEDPDGDLVVSVQSLGERRFGELVIEGLRP